MSPFEYVTVLISVVISLGITQILKFIATLIKKSKRVIYYWPHLLWVLFVLLLHIQEWWILYELKSIPSWRLPLFLFVMLYPVNLYLLARMLYPDKFAEDKIDLKQFYFESFPKIFFLTAVSAFLSVLYNRYILEMKWSEQILQIILITTLGLIAWRRVMNEWIHKSISLIITGSLLIIIIIEWNVWLVE